jgi:hypothetical protein
VGGRPPYRPSAPSARFTPPQQRDQNFKGPHKPYKMAVQSNKATATARQGSSNGDLGSASIVKGPCYKL